MPLIPIDGIRLMVDDTGSGDPLVLVHGSWDDRRVWAAATDELSRSFRVITYDRRGHTDSEDGSTPGTRRDDEDDLVALIETLELAPAHVVANSFGGAIAVGLAARQPELLRSLSVHEPPLFPLAGEDVIPEQVGEVIGDVVAMIDRGEREEAARVFVEQVALGPGAWDYVPPEDRTMMIGNAGTFTGEQRDPAWGDVDVDALGRVECPVLLTKGGESPPFFAAVVEALSSAIPHAEVRILPGAGHVPHETHLAEYVAVLREFARPATPGR